jgi:hypothetical protein
LDIGAYAADLLVNIQCVVYFKKSKKNGLAPNEVQLLHDG